MTTIAVCALVLALVALVVALGARRSPPTATAPSAHPAFDPTRELATRLDRVERWLRMLADGKPVTGEMIEEGRLYPEISSDEAQRWIEVERRPGLLVIDVRTPPEVEGGHIEGMKWIPMDELEERAREVPRDRPVLVFCAAGGRSAAACDFLTSRGHANVVNVVGGMSAWRGRVKTGKPA